MDEAARAEARANGRPSIWRSIDARGAGRAQALAAAAGLLAAVASASCCILPVAFFGLGISGAWIANFTRLAPYQPFFAAAAVGFIAFGYWLLRRAAQCACAGACAHPLPTRVVRIALVAATFLVIGAVGFDYVAPYLLP